MNLDSHLVSSSSQFSASLMDCPALDQLFPLAQGEAVRALHRYLRLEMETAERHRSLVD